MREIKFRAWDKDLAKYLEGCEIGSLMADLDAEDDVNDGRSIVIRQICPARYIFEQCTGLKDKNGKEIYEGDIVRYDAIDYEIYWLGEYACWSNRRMDKGEEVYSTASFFSVAGLGNIIGNIHENPELLNPRNSTELGEIK